MIDDLLDFSKIEAGMLELDISSFGLRDVLDELIRALAVRAVRKGLRLTWSVANDVPEQLVGDVGRLRQVLLNLIGNAIKFTSVGLVDVDVRCQSEPEDKLTLTFLIRDTGIGIPVDKQAMIFQAFTQQDTSTTRIYGGTGLGLTIAARLAGLMGGQITVDSQPARGSAFTFTARFGIQRDQPSPAVAPTVFRPAPTRPLRVLIAEDQELNSQLTCDLLARRGHHTGVATTGQEALRMLALQTFDLLLLDLHMPALDGFGVIQQIRESERLTGAHLPVIALTARSRPEDRERCLAAGMDDFVTKPIRGAALIAAIERVAQRATLLDPQALLAACDEDPFIFTRVRDALQRSIPNELSAIERALCARDLHAVREAAHRLSSIIGTASTSVGEFASKLEDEAAGGNFDAIRPRVAKLPILAERVLSELARTSLDELLKGTPKGNLR